MAIAVSLLKYSAGVNPDRVYVKCTFSGSYVAGGDTLNLNPQTWTDPLNLGNIGQPDQVPVVAPSVFDTQYVAASASVGGYADVVPGATLATFKLQQFAPGGSEVAAATYPVGISGGYVIVEIQF